MYNFVVLGFPYGYKKDLMSKYFHPIQERKSLKPNLSYIIKSEIPALGLIESKALPKDCRGHE